MHTAPRHTAVATVRTDGAYTAHVWEATQPDALWLAVFRHDPFRRRSVGAHANLRDVLGLLPRERKDRATSVPELDVEALTLEPACVAAVNGVRHHTWEDDTDAEAMEQAVWDMDPFQEAVALDACFPAAEVGALLPA